MNGKKPGIGVYIHIPFCLQKCGYCDFVSFPRCEESYEAYVNALISEIKAEKRLVNYEINSVFIGGGTPTVLPCLFILRIMEALSLFDIHPNAEITIEANPKTLNKEMLRELKSAGINRLSIGLQAWQDNLLETLGRAHRLNDFIINFNDARDAGFHNISTDLMFALPGQTMADWQETLEHVVKLGPEHISAYSLIIEENTPFYQLQAQGQLALPGEDMEAGMFALTRSFLKGSGYTQYEISNFAKPDFYSRHNVLYWERGNYRGFGLAAHSLMENKRFENTGDLACYLANALDAKKIRTSETRLTVADAMAEFMFLGLRMVQGIDKNTFLKTFGMEIEAVYKNPIQKNISLGLLKAQEGRLFLTDRGMEIGNMVMADFLLD